MTTLLDIADVVSVDWDATHSSEFGTPVGGEASTRVIAGNSAQDIAVQLFCPIGKDLWQDARVRIENNTATDGSLQLGYPVSLESFKTILDHRERILKEADMNR